MARRTSSTSVDPGRGQAGQVGPSPVDVVLEVPGVDPEADRQLGGDPPAEVLERVGRRVPGGEHGRSEALHVPVPVTGGGADVVGGDDPATVLIDPAQDDDHAEPGQLVVVEHRPGPGAATSKTSSSASAWMVAARPYPIDAARMASRASAPQVYDGRWSESSGMSRTVSSGRTGRRLPTRAVAPRRPAPGDRGPWPAELRRPGAASRRSRRPRPARSPGRRAAGRRAGRRGAWTCPAPGPRPRRRSGPVPR